MSPSLPDTMTAIEISAPGGPEVLGPGRRPLPQGAGSRKGHGPRLTGPVV